jgi:molybdopterin-biosynthesis enzyme MoeA-like protein
VLHNQVGTAPGMWMKKETPFYFAAGVPYEMKYWLKSFKGCEKENTNGRTLSTKQFLLTDRREV